MSEIGALIDQAAENECAGGLDKIVEHDEEGACAGEHEDKVP